MCLPAYIPFVLIVHARNRPLCKYQQENAALFESHPELAAPIAPGMPSILELQSYLRDFTESHRPSFQSILHSKLLIMGGAAKVLTKENPQICLIPLKYRPPGPEGVNPAITFSYENCVFLPRARVLSDAVEHRPRLLQAWDQSATSRAHVTATFANDPDFVDILPVVFAPHGSPAQFGYFPTYSALGGDHSVLPREAVKSQLETYVEFIELGIVMRSPTPSAAPIPGFMQKLGDGKKWEWRPLWKNWHRDPEWARAKSTKDRVKLLERKLAEAHRETR